MLRSSLIRDCSFSFTYSVRWLLLHRASCMLDAGAGTLSSAADPRSRFGFGKFKVFRIDYCLLIAFVHTGHCCC